MPELYCLILFRKSFYWMDEPPRISIRGSSAGGYTGNLALLLELHMSLDSFGEFKTMQK